VNTTTTSETWSSRGERWHADHQAFVDAWLELLAASEPPEDDDLMVRDFAASSLLRVPEVRGYIHLLGEPEREPLTWNAIDAYEILFQQIVYGGHPFIEPREYLRLIGSFAAYLGDIGIIPPREHAQLRAEWGVWSERLLQVWEGKGWYERDGTYVPPGEFRRPPLPAARRTRPRARLGPFRRRARSARRRC